MRIQQRKIVLACVHVVFLSMLFFTLCQNVAYAQLVTDCTNPLPGGDCGWAKLEGVARAIVNFALLIAAPIAAIAFMWAGIKYLTAAGNESQIKEAHNIFTNVLIGFVIVLAAWLIVKVIFSAFVKPSLPNLLD